MSLIDDEALERIALDAIRSDVEREVRRCLEEGDTFRYRDPNGFPHDWHPNDLADMLLEEMSYQDRTLLVYALLNLNQSQTAAHNDLVNIKKKFEGALQKFVEEQVQRRFEHQPPEYDEEPEWIWEDRQQRYAQ